MLRIGFKARLSEGRNPCRLATNFNLLGANQRLNFMPKASDYAEAYALCHGELFGLAVKEFGY
jgi:hypothetical protein